MTKRVVTLLVWMAFVAIISAGVRWRFGDVADFGLRGYAVSGVIVFVTFFLINHAAAVVPLRRRLAAAVEAQDPDALDAVLNEALAKWPRSVKIRAFVDMNRAVALMFREHWDEAVARVRTSLAGVAATKNEPVLLNNLAWALAHAGELDEAAIVGERALAAAATGRVRAHANGTLGAIYALQGEADRAIHHLDAADAISHDGAAIQATRQYYRGVAFRAKGHDADAIRAFEAACAVAPSSTFGRRASFVLVSLKGVVRE